MEAIKHRLANSGLSPTDIARRDWWISTRNRLQGQGGHRVTRSARFVFAPGNVVIHLEVWHRA